MATALTKCELPPTPRWLHLWAVFTLCATFVGLFLGSLVTTMRVGMADPVWPTAPWYLLVFDWIEPKPGFIIEHSHRAAMYLVGLCAIVLAFGLWRREPRLWVRWLGAVALGGVILQGLLGGLRVLLDRYLGTDLAFAHGCLAQLVAALLVSIACVTSPGWSSHVSGNTDSKKIVQLRIVSLTLAVLIYGQIVFGAVLRHTYSLLGSRGHLLTAFAVVAGVVWLLRETWEHHSQERGLTIPAIVLSVLVVVQLVMGVEAWLLRLMAVSPANQVWIKTAHVALGYLVFATSVVAALQAFRPALNRGVERHLPLRPLEGAA